MKAVTFLLFLAFLFTFSQAKSIIPQPQQFRSFKINNTQVRNYSLKIPTWCFDLFLKRQIPLEQEFFFSLFFGSKNSGLQTDRQVNLNKIILFQCKNQKKVMSQFLSYFSKINTNFLVEFKELLLHSINNDKLFINQIYKGSNQSCIW